MAIEVNAKDVNDAENFLEEFLTDSVADGDYTDGTALRDLTVKAIAFNFAYLRKVAAQVRVRQSLKTISEVDTSDDPEAADDAVDEILSNWFAGRQTGTYTHITAYAHVSQPVDITVAAETLFYKTADRVFVLDNNGEDLFVSAEELTALFSSTGETSDYVFPIPLIAELPGTDYNIAPGAFSSFDAFSPYVTRVETLETASGGEGVETSTDYLERASSLVTVRNLINARSNDAVLREEFSDVKRTLTVGMGDPEMARDLIKEDATGIEMHVGAHMDTFLFMNTVETSFSGVVGAPYARPDGLIVVFRDATYTGVTLFTANVTPGMVLRIKAYLPIEPHDYMIREVYDTTLVVSTRVPFPVATDEQSPVGYVTWSIGHLAPGFEDIIPNQVTGETSRQMQNSGRITLPGGPVYLIKDVTIDDPADLDADSEDGLVHL
ncbi:hypothetical protein KJ782_07165, partial [Patescibacteria group bacterium]|nr:hypothetical protein [Patescibacteria group bacterium]